MSHILLLEYKNEDIIEESIIVIRGHLAPKCNSSRVKLNHKSVLLDQYKNFKHLVHLKNGRNKLTLSCGHIEHNFTIIFKENYRSLYSVLPVAVYFSDSEINCQLENSFSLVINLVQCFYRETLLKEIKKTLSFKLFSSKCNSLKINLTTQEARLMKKEDLWYFIKDFLANYYQVDDSVIFLAILAHHEYKFIDKIPISFEEKLDRNPFYINLGNKNLALINSSCSYSWPRTVNELNDVFYNDRNVDLLFQFDENHHHGSYSENLSSSIGSIAHELGHCFGLDHLERGIMNRGGDDAFRIFSLNCTECEECLTEPYEIKISQANLSYESLNFLPQQYEENNAQNICTTSCLCQSHFGEAFWSLPCSILLENNRWMSRKLEQLENNTGFIFTNTQIQSNCPIKSIQVRFCENDVNAGITDMYHSFDRYIYRIEIFKRENNIRNIEIITYLPRNWDKPIKFVVSDFNGGIICKHIKSKK